MTKLKPGDKVRIVKSKTYESNSEEASVGWVSPYMDEKIGKIVTLELKGANGYSWKLKEINFWYHENWLKPVVREKLTFKKFFEKTNV